MSTLHSPMEEKSSSDLRELAHVPTDAEIVSKDGQVTRGFALQRTDDYEEPTLHFRTIITIASLCFAAYGINIGVTSTGFWLGSVIASLGPSSDSIFFATSWLIVQVGLTPIFGMMSDFGAPTRKWLCVGLFVPPIIGLCVAGSCHSWGVGIFGVALFGPAVITYGPQAAIASDIVPRRMRGFIQGILYSSQALGSITASVGGGAMIRDNVGGNGGWRWIMFLGAIALAVAGLGIAVAYQPIRHPEIHEKPYLQRMLGLDWIGTILFSCGMVPFLLGLDFGGNKMPWRSAGPISCLCIGCVFFIIFGLHQFFIKKDGVFNHRLFRNRNFAIALIVIWVEGVVYITLNTFLGQQVSILYEQRPVYIGLHFATILFCAGASSSLSGYYSHKFKEFRGPLILGYLLFIGACVGFSKAGIGPNADRIIYGMCALTGLGFGPPLALVLAVAQLSVDPDLTGSASSLIIGIRSFGGVTGASIAGAIFTGKINVYLPQKIASYGLAAGVSQSEIGQFIGAVASSGKTAFPSDVTPDQIAAGITGLRDAFASSFSYVYYMIMPFAALSVILLCFLKSNKEQMTWSITTPAEDYERLGVSRAVKLEELKA